MGASRWHTTTVDAPMIWYFAYGSNMSHAIFVERRGMRPTAARVGWIEGYRLCFDLPVGPGERGVANVVAQDGARTWGVLYEITHAEGDHLDRTEGVLGGYYRRIDVAVAVPEGQPVAAFTYHSAFGTHGRKPSARYIGLLLDGARRHGLPAEYIASLSSYELAIDERTPPQR